MAKTSIKTINEFLEPRKFALIGLSRNEKSFSRLAFKELRAKGYTIYPVNPNIDEVDGVKCYRDIAQLPQDVRHAVFMTPKDKTVEALLEGIDHGFTHIWLQQGTESPDAMSTAAEKGVKLVSKTCLLMHADPKGVHKFHGSIMKFFGAFSNN